MTWDIKKEPHEELFGLLKHIKEQQGMREDEYKLWTATYLDAPVNSFSWSTLDRYTRSPSAQFVDVGFNLAESCVDTIYNRVGKMRPKPGFVTEGGDYKLQYQAKKLDRFVYAQFQANKFYDHAQFAFRDAEIYGDGFVKMYVEGENVKYERVFPGEIHVDKTEAFYSDPRRMYQAKGIAREKLIQQFPDSKSLLMNTNKITGQAANYYLSSPYVDLIEVAEAWKLPVVETKNNKVEVIEPGKHVICTDNATLFTEDWEHPFFPFIHYPWKRRPLGFWSMGVVEEIFSIHKELNQLLRDVQENMHFCSAPFWTVDETSEIAPAHITNEIGRIVKFKGKPPMLSVFDTTAPEIFNHIQFLINSGYQKIGLSQLSAQSQKPSGLDSGKALREFDDIESERMVTVGQMIEGKVIEAATMTVELFRGIAKKNPEVSVKAKYQNFLQEIKWKEVDMESNKYMIDVLPKSSLSRSFSNRLSDVQDLLNLGVVDPVDAAELMELPDVKSKMTLITMNRELIRETVDRILNGEDDYTQPQKWMDLGFAVEYTTQIRAELELSRSEGKEVDALNAWADEAATLLSMAKQAAMAQSQPAPQPQQAQANNAPIDMSPMAPSSIA